MIKCHNEEHFCRISSLNWKHEKTNKQISSQNLFPQDFHDTVWKPKRFGWVWKAPHEAIFVQLSECLSTAILLRWLRWHCSLEQIIKFVLLAL